VLDALFTSALSKSGRLHIRKRKIHIQSKTRERCRKVARDFCGASASEKTAQLSTRNGEDCTQDRKEEWCVLIWRGGKPRALKVTGNLKSKWGQRGREMKKNHR